MNVVSNPELLRSYIVQYALNSLFKTDLTGQMTLFHCPRGTLVCESSAKLQSLYFLVSGKLKIYTLLDNGKSLLLRFNKPLSVVGDLEFLSQLVVKCNVETQRDSFLIGIPFSVLYREAYHDPTFLRFLITNLSYKLYSASNSASLNQLYPLENRLAGYLLSVSVNDDETSRTAELKAQKLTEIAMLLGTSYRHLSRVITKFRRNGILTTTKGSLTILDLPKLKILAKENIYE